MAAENLLFVLILFSPIIALVVIGIVLYKWTHRPSRQIQKALNVLVKEEYQTRVEREAAEEKLIDYGAKSVPYIVTQIKRETDFSFNLFYLLKKIDASAAQDIAEIYYPRIPADEFLSKYALLVFLVAQRSAKVSAYYKDALQKLALAYQDETENKDLNYLQSAGKKLLLLSTELTDEWAKSVSRIFLKIRNEWESSVKKIKTGTDTREEIKRVETGRMVTELTRDPSFPRSMPTKDYMLIRHTVPEVIEVKETQSVDVFKTIYPEWDYVIKTLQTISNQNLI